MPSYLCNSSWFNNLVILVRCLAYSLIQCCRLLCKSWYLLDYVEESRQRISHPIIDKELWLWLIHSSYLQCYSWSPQNLTTYNGLKRTATLYTWADVVWEIALKGCDVMFCPPLTTWNLTLSVIHWILSSLTRTFSNVSLAIDVYNHSEENNLNNKYNVL